MPTIPLPPAPLTADPPSSLITDNVMATLATLTRANGYHNDYSVEARQKEPSAPGDYKIVVLDGDDREPHVDPPWAPQLAGENATPFHDQAWLRQYLLFCYVFDSDQPTTRFERLCAIARADIEYAMMLGRRRGGWAIDTYVRQPYYFGDPNSPDGIVTVFDVHYRTAEDDPFTSRSVS